MTFEPRIGGYVRMVHQEWVGVIERIDDSVHVTNVRLKIRPVFLPERSEAPSVMVMLSEVTPISLLEALAWASLDP